MFKGLFLLLCSGYLHDENYRMASDCFSKISVVSLSKPGRLEYDYYGLSIGVYRNDPEMVKKHALGVINTFQDCPVRYTHLAEIVLLDIEHWNTEGLDHLQRDMGGVKRDLKAGFTDRVVVMKQKDVLDQIDKMIKDKEEQMKPKPGAGVPESAEAFRPIPLPDSIPGMESGKGEVAAKKLKELAEGWGKMPEKERARAIVEITKDYPARYRVVIEEYFKALSRQK